MSKRTMPYPGEVVITSAPTEGEAWEVAHHLARLVTTFGAQQQFSVALRHIAGDRDHVLVCLVPYEPDGREV